MPCPAAFDIVNHFSEWAGFGCDYTLLPTRSVRREFLHEYVRSYLGHRRPNSAIQEEEDLVNRLLNEVDAFRGLPGFFWYDSRGCENR
jgi:ethanolamine kinase